METIILLIGFIVIMLYLFHLDKKTTKMSELLLMSEQEKKDYVESVSQVAKAKIDELRR